MQMATFAGNPNSSAYAGERVTPEYLNFSYPDSNRSSLLETCPRDRIPRGKHKKIVSFHVLEIRSLQPKEAHCGT